MTASGRDHCRGREGAERRGAKYDTAFEYTDAPIGGAAIDATDNPLPEATLDAARA